MSSIVNINALEWCVTNRLSIRTLREVEHPTSVPSQFSHFHLHTGASVSCTTLLTEKDCEHRPSMDTSTVSADCAKTRVKKQVLLRVATI
eukprot:SAG31_NODE_3672_length_4001_cov_3.839313_4_plen_90_part_00